MTGRLIWNQDRPDIAFDTGMLYGGLHCGDCFQCWIGGRWLDVRLEYAQDWALIHHHRAEPVCYGALVRLESSRRQLLRFFCSS